jgi:hypothetical protein
MMMLMMMMMMNKHPVLRANRHTGTNFYDVQRIQVKHEEGCVSVGMEDLGFSLLSLLAQKSSSK